MKTAVLGSGGWGTALAMVLADNGHDVTLWSYLEEESRTLQETRENPLLPGVKLPDSIRYTWDLSCVRGCQVVVMATPSFGVRSTASQIKAFLTPDMTLVSVSKGIEKGTSLRMTQIIQEATGGICPVVALSGPSHAEEVARGAPTAVVSACPDRAAAERVQDLFLNERFRVYSSSDVIGVELGGALKNIMALCSGCVTGMGCGDNTKAMLMTRGLTEIARLGVALGGTKDTFAGLAGMGDLIVTCTSMNSRNYRAGLLIGQGVPVPEAVKKIGAVVEGYYAVDSARELAQRAGVEMPITQAAYQVLYEGGDPQTLFQQLMRREKRHETEEGWL
ncbi:MAG: NAD(P)-dependent glycerol-3-phosphate dehydrogenase [Clostridiales bacterium]|nr:NAD(P)-dependent glycerol-3-phosphate dehydrogenase [Clostridiales bacterium]MDY3991954.1 NAD(P)H-dependent glycerol-3-phosphate dehydrogenase [Evtepia sp.]